MKVECTGCGISTATGSSSDESKSDRVRTFLIDNIFGIARAPTVNLKHFYRVCLLNDITYNSSKGLLILDTNFASFDSTDCQLLG